MRTLQDILLAGLLILSLNVSGQDLRRLNTKDLIKISEDFGLDSALYLTSGLPIYYIDKLVAWKLVGQTLNYKASDKAESFLVDYALHVKDKKLPEILYSFFDRKRNDIADYKPDDFHGLPRISEDALVALIVNSSNKTDSLLFQYYHDWEVKSKAYESEYLKGKAEMDARKKEKLMSPFEDCNYNCYTILLALDSMKSKFFDQTKLERHQKNLKYYWQRGFHFDKTGDFTDYKRDNVFKTIKLKNQYKTIGDIDFEKESELKKILNQYDKSYCRKFIMYNDKIGYLDLGCQSDPLAGYGVLYRLELIENKLIIYEIQNWIS
ncbi:MAG TPA: hypothetical protein VFC67_22585 [Prolixibacteraceae bacterium]|nr:hypothetical protein [Prolixibacteraceae bacterium]